MIDLDANFLVDLLRSGHSARRLEQWAIPPQEINISAVAWAEFLCGPLPPNAAANARAVLDKIEPLIADDAQFAARIFNETGRRLRSLPDCMIAAIAIRRGAALATLNAADFKRFQHFGLKLAK